MKQLALRLWSRIAGGAALTLTLGAAGCVEPQPVLSSAAEQELFVLSTAIWSSTSIPVCWENAGRDAEKAIVRAAVKRTWELETGVVFEGWGTCTPGARGIRIRQDNSWPRSGIGSQLDGVADGMHLNFDFTFYKQTAPGVWDQPFGACIGNEKVCSENIAVHEFGHALGFIHEQDRSDTPTTCTKQTGDYGDTPVGAYDATSIMNYCNPTWNNAGKLSANDVAGARQFYGYSAGQDLQFHIADVTGDRVPDIFQTYRGWGSAPTCAGRLINIFYGFSACTNPAATMYDSGSPAQQVVTGDFDGDRKTDFAQVYRKFGSIPRCLATGSGWSCSNPAADLHPEAADTHERRFLVGKFLAGDVRDGIVQVFRGLGSIPLCAATATGWSCSNPGATIHDSGSREQQFLAADVTGDGLTDIVQTYRGWGSVPVCAATGSGGWSCDNQPATIYDAPAEMRFVTADVNADRRADVLQVYRGWRSIPTCTRTAAGTWSCSNPAADVYDSGSHEQQFLTGDFNGDGRTDVIQTFRGWGSMPVCLATAAGGWSCSNPAALIKDSGSAEQRFIAADLNRDGKTDIVQVYRGWTKYPVCLSTGTGWDCVEVSSTIYNPGY